MKISTSVKFAFLGLVALILVSAATAFAAGITVSPSNAGQESVPVTAEDLKPAACDGITLTQVISGSGTFTGTSENDLLIGSPGSDSIDGLGGDDCILGGGGDDSLTGNEGADICLGGPDIDTFFTCEGESQ